MPRLKELLKYSHSFHLPPLRQTPPSTREALSPRGSLGMTCKMQNTTRCTNFAHTFCVFVHPVPFQTRKRGGPPPLLRNYVPTQKERRSALLIVFIYSLYILL